MWKVHELLMFVFTLETSGYDFSRAPKKGPQEGPKGCRDTALSLDELKGHPVGGLTPLRWALVLEKAWPHDNLRLK